MWAIYPESDALFAPTGRPLVEGDHFVQAELADALTLIAERGPEVLYGGELGKEIVESLAADDGFLSLQDLEDYEPIVRRPVETDAFGWQIESNPPPAVGGAVLTHMLALLGEADLRDPTTRLSAIAEAQRAATGYRKERYGDPSSVAAGLELEEALAQLARKALPSSETTHTSAADSDGYVCSITESNGYGAGLVVHGILLNDTLGEEELNPLGVHRLPAGLVVTPT
jgi:gamma-glutamyltranspeptidase / glutathione hydrolase